MRNDLPFNTEKIIDSIKLYFYINNLDYEYLSIYLKSKGEKKNIYQKKIKLFIIKNPLNLHSFCKF